MDATRLTEQFEELATTAGGIDGVRRLILRLAICGKLVERCPADESVGELLSGIGLEDCIVEPTLTLPQSWRELRLGSLGKLSGGGTPSKREAQFWDGEIPWVSPKDMKRLRIADAIDHVTPAALADGGGKLRLLPPGAMLMVVRGMILAHSFPVALTEVPVTINQDMKAMVLFDDRLADWLLLTLRAHRDRALSTVERSTHGTCRMPTDGLLALPIPLPPLPEQKRIVAKVDELMTLCDELEQRQEKRHRIRRSLQEAAFHALANAEAADDLATAWQRVRTHWTDLTSHADAIPHLRQAILQLAVRGRLVEQREEDGRTAQDLLKATVELQEERAAGRRRPKHRLDEQSHIHELPELPQGWLQVRLADIVANRDSERIPLSRAERSTRAGPYDYYGASGVIDSIDDFIFDEPLLLVGEDGANLLLRSTPIAFIASGKYWVNNHAHVLEAVSMEVLRFIAVALNATDLKPYVTGTAQPKMNQRKMNSILIPLPPEVEQKRIIAKVDELMTLCDALEARALEAEGLAERFAEAAVAGVV